MQAAERSDFSMQVCGVAGAAEAPPEVQQQLMSRVHARQAVRTEAAADDQRPHGAHAA